MLTLTMVEMVEGKLWRPRLIDCSKECSEPWPSKQICLGNRLPRFHHQRPVRQVKPWAGACHQLNQVVFLLLLAMGRSQWGEAKVTDLTRYL